MAIAQNSATQNSASDNETRLQKANALIHRFDPHFRHRWEVWNELILARLHPHTVWIDGGCGSNAIVQAFGAKAGKAIGVDIFEAPKVQSETDTHYVQGDVRSLPFADNSVDLVTLRFVVEHLEKKQDLLDIARVLKPGGELMIVTTNLLSPFIAIGQLFPYSLKTRLIQSVFSVQSEDVFPTHHPMNTPAAMRRGIAPLRLKELHLISDINYRRKPLLYLLLFFHLFTKYLHLPFLRANMIAVFEKTPSEKEGEKGRGEAEYE